MNLWEKLSGRMRSRAPQAVNPGPAAARTPEAAVPGDAETRLRSGVAPAAGAPAALAADAAGKIAGTFPVKRVLGAGGMGTVYLVQHPSWNTEVALKVPKAELIADAANRHRIVLEAETWTELGLHPHIAYCYYAQTIDQVLLLVVEYVDGGNLAHWIGKHGPSAELKAKLDLAIQFCHALEHAHGRGLIHRDIKPANVLLTREGELKLTDFGIARIGAVDTSERASTAATPVDATIAGIGTEDYMPPEQWHSTQVDARADLFAFGVCLYELVCGRRPYHGRLIGAARQPLDPLALSPALPQALGALMQQCVHWDKTERPESARAIRQRLTAIYEEHFHQPSAYADLPPYTVTAAALNNHALSYIELGKIELAEQAWQAALQADARHIETIYNQGLHEWRRARLTDDALIKRIEEAAADQSTAWLPAYLQALVCLESGDTESAEHCLEAIPTNERGRVEIQMASQTVHKLVAGAMPVRRYAGHSAAVTSVVATADGRYALSSSEDRTIKLWDLANGECIRTLTGHDDRVVSLCMSADGAFAASAGTDGFKLWHLATGDCPRSIRGSFHSVSLSANSRLALTCSGGPGDNVKIWDIAGGYCWQSFNAHVNLVFSACLSADGRIALTCGDETRPRLWNVDTGDCLRALDGHTEWVRSVCLSFDNRHALSASDDHAVRLWDLASGECLRTFIGHVTQVRSVRLSADGRSLLSRDTAGTVRLWDVANGRCLRSIATRPDELTSVQLSADAAQALIGSRDGGLEAWPLSARRLPAPYRITQVDTGRNLIRAGSAYRQAVLRARRALAGGESSEARRLLMSARGGVFRRHPEGFAAWASLYVKLRKGRLRDDWVCALPAAHGGVCTDTDARFAFSRGGDVIVLRDLATGQCMYSAAAGRRDVISSCISSDGRHVLWGSSNHTVELRDVATGSCLRTFVGHTNPVTSVALSTDGRLALSGSLDRTVKLWNVATGQLLRNLVTGGWVQAVLLSGDGRHALSGGDSGHNAETLQLWDLTTGTCVCDFAGHRTSLTSLAMSADGRIAISGSTDKVVRVWDIRGGRCLRTLAGHTDRVSCVCLSANAQHAISGSWDATLKLWDLASEECVHTLPGHASSVRSVCFSADGSFVVSAGDGGLKLWTLDWELEDNEPADWDEGARPYLDVFLRAQQPYLATLPADRTPTDEEITRALTRGGVPAWNEDDFQRLLHTLGCAGYGWLRADGVRRELERAAARDSYALMEPPA